MLNVDTLEYMLKEQKYKPFAIVPDGEGNYFCYYKPHNRDGVTQNTLQSRMRKINKKHGVRLMSTQHGWDNRGHYFVVREERD